MLSLHHLNRSDRLVLLLTMAVLMLSVVAVWLLGSEQGGGVTATADSTAAVQRGGPRARTYYYKVPSAVAQPELFPFDPNTADSTQLLRLGLRPWQVRNVYKYRAAGGVFRRPTDFARLYGLTVDEYRRLEPYIRISADSRPASVLVDSAPRAARDTLRRPLKLKQGEHVVLNTADSTALRRVPGIGDYYAAEVLRYGERLGGYVSVDQLDELDDFPTDAKQYFVVAAPKPRQLNLNKLTLPQLRRHPYINFYQARAIIDHRRLRGPLKSLDDLRLSPAFTPADLQRLQPYVTF